jgi:hypothetical protein
MNKLIKSEMNKNKHITGYWIFIMGIVLLMFTVPLFGEDKSVMGFIDNQCSELFVILVMMTTAFLTGRGFSQRTNMYDIMIGNRPMRIITSKVIAIGVTTTAIVSLGSLIGFFISCAIDSSHFSYALAKEFVCLLVMFRAAVTGVLMTLVFRSLASIALVYCRIMLESIALLIYGSIHGNLNNIMDSFRGVPRIFDILFYSNQLSSICEKYTLDPDVVINVVGGFGITVVFWGVLAYYLYKHRDF